MIKNLQERTTFLYRDANGVEHHRAFLICDTADELEDAELAIIPEMGSIATCMQTGEVYTLNSVGEWKNAGGEEA